MEFYTAKNTNMNWTWNYLEKHLKIFDLSAKVKMLISTLLQTYPPKKTQRFKSVFGFSIFWVFGFWLWAWVFCKSFANFELDNLIYKQKFLIFGYGFEYQFCFFFTNFLNLCSNPYPKIKKFCLYFKLSNSKFARDLHTTQTQILKKLKTQIHTSTFWFYWVHMSETLFYNKVKLTSLKHMNIIIIIIRRRRRRKSKITRLCSWIASYLELYWTGSVTSFCYSLTWQTASPVANSARHPTRHACDCCCCGQSRGVCAFCGQPATAPTPRRRHHLW